MKIGTQWFLRAWLVLAGEELTTEDRLASVTRSGGDGVSDRAASEAANPTVPASSRTWGTVTSHSFGGGKCR
ncbi:hypothetical protein ACFL27_09405 [candidate division CSSED10-310 bacterium]|uniref:Uncharacterized protein n=1 Tax=candidate division CSSED10-310 bacterium TaxID=2855610 RepID=A0ABV6YWF6_UNCC1